MQMKNSSHSGLDGLISVEGLCSVGFSWESSKMESTLEGA